MAEDLPDHVEEKREWCDCDADSLGYHHDDVGRECHLCKLTDQHGHCEKCKKLVGAG